MTHTFKFAGSICLLIATLLAGCARFDMARKIPWGEGRDGQIEQPLKVVAIWADTVMQQAGRPSQRGFGGRLMFYAQEGGKPVKVDGTLVVYAFDEAGRELTDVVPDRKFVIEPEDFKKHYSKSTIGHSYSIWMPWDEVGGPQTDVSLIVRFISTGGAVVVGEQSKQLLPGVPPGSSQARRKTIQRRETLREGMPEAKAPEESSQEDTLVTPASYVDEENSDEETGADVEAPSKLSLQQRMKITTIPMPARMGRAAALANRPAQLPRRRANKANQDAKEHSAPEDDENTRSRDATNDEAAKAPSRDEPGRTHLEQPRPRRDHSALRKLRAPRGQAVGRSGDDAPWELYRRVPLSDSAHPLSRRPAIRERAPETSDE